MDSLYNSHQGQRQAAKQTQGTHRTSTAREAGKPQDNGLSHLVNFVWSFCHVGGLSGSADSLALVT